LNLWAGRVIRARRGPEDTGPTLITTATITAWPSGARTCPHKPCLFAEQLFAAQELVVFRQTIGTAGRGTSRRPARWRRGIPRPACAFLKPRRLSSAGRAT
jgi:hypothetical protein